MQQLGSYEIDDDQFADAAEDGAVGGIVVDQQLSNPRGDGNYIDDVPYSTPESEDDYDEEINSDDLLEESLFNGNRVEDEDWEIAERGELSRKYHTEILEQMNNLLLNQILQSNTTA